MSTLRTRAPSFANSAARGRPTTSDLLPTGLSYVLPHHGWAYRLMTVMTFPRARSPYSSILLYTPICSSTLTIASGVHGKIDLTVPSGACSPMSGFVVNTTGGRVPGGGGLRVSGEMKRMLPVEGSNG